MNLSYEQARDYAIKNYEAGGDVFVECWDKKDFDEYIKACGPFTKTKLRRLFRIWDEQYKATQF